VKRQGNYFLLLDYDPTTEEDLFFNTMSLIMATPRFPPDLFEILGIETKSYTPSSIYCQEPAYSRDQEKRKQKKMRNLLFTKKTQTKIQNPNQKPVLDLKQQRRNAIEERRTRKQKT